MRAAAKDHEYLRWIKSRPCAVPGCRQRTPTEAHHFGPRAFGRKAPDRQALPLCTEHHRTGREAAHYLGRYFEARHQIDAWAEISQLNEIYEREMS